MKRLKFLALLMALVLVVFGLPEQTYATSVIYLDDMPKYIGVTLEPHSSSMPDVNPPSTDTPTPTSDNSGILMERPTAPVSDVQLQEIETAFYRWEFKITGREFSAIE